MKWEADQRLGYFGWTPTYGRPPQLRYKARVDLDEALDAVADVLERFWACLTWPSAPPFTGGVLDAWPARLADGLAICRAEWAAVQDMVKAEAEERARKEQPHG